jgi:hypothetical protein
VIFSRKKRKNLTFPALFQDLSCLRSEKMWNISIFGVYLVCIYKFDEEYHAALASGKFKNRFLRRPGCSAGGGRGLFFR